MSIASIEGRWQDPATGRTAGYRRWKPAHARALLVVVHGFGEHSGRYDVLARQLAEQGMDVAAADIWAHGRSEGRRGDIESVDAIVRQIRLMTEKVFLPEFGHSEYVLYGHSFGGLIAILLAAGRPAGLRRLIAQSPLLEVGFEVPRWKIVAANILRRVWPACTLSMNLDISALSRDPAVPAAYRNDPLVHGCMSARTYWSLQEAKRRAMAQAPMVRVPTLLLCGEADRIISVEAARQWFERLDTVKRFVSFPDCYHELHHEAVRDEVARLVAEWTLTP